MFSSRTALRRGVLGAIAVVALLVLLSLGIQRYAPFMFDAEQLRTQVSQFGVLAPVVIVLIQAVQVVVAPVPGQVVALASGYIFGPVAGSAYSFVGVLIGSAIAFSLTKRFGRPVAERLLHEEILNRFDDFVDRVGIVGMFVFVMIPGLPDDAVCFLCGLTDWRLRTFLAVIAVGRFPAYLVTVYAGEELASGRLGVALALLAVVIVASVVGYYKQDAIRNTVERFR
ncbi:MAG: hypothetical protein J07HX64_02920 [halophilic archaeon J07HX64]|nr:MAG: hypothetical protein J07HX64_02920 [halophilic archaeon J07HX64]